MDRLAFFLQLIFAAFRESGAQLLGLNLIGEYVRLNQLSVKRLAGIINRHEALPGPLSSWMFLRNCTLLNLKLSNLFGEQSSLENQQTVVRFLKLVTQSLISLKFQGQNRTDTVLLTIVNALAKNVPFPKLEHLHLSGGNIEYRSLLAFFEKHSLTMKSVTLRTISTNAGQWPSLLTKLSDLNYPSSRSLIYFA